MKGLVERDAKAFRRRWAAANAVSHREARALTPEDRLRELDALSLFARSVERGPDLRRIAEERRVRARWNRLRRALRGIA